MQTLMQLNTINIRKKFIHILTVSAHLILIIICYLFLQHEWQNLKKMVKKEDLLKDLYVKNLKLEKETLQIMQILKITEIKKKWLPNQIPANLAKISQNFSLQLLTVSPELPSSQIFPIPFRTFQFEAYGNYQNILAFLKYLSNHNWLIDIKKLILRKKEAESYNSIYLQMQMEVYHY